ncbi:hypothetical protein [Sulfobacillus thermotolerans]
MMTMAAKKSVTYGVLWTGRQWGDPVVFYRVQTNESFRVLQQYLMSHTEWESRFHWSPRRWRHYQQELTRQGIPWMVYEETRTGWRVSTKTPAPPWLGEHKTVSLQSLKVS